MNKTGIFEISFKHISRLDEVQLTDLLNSLLRLEAKELGVPQRNVICSLKTKVKDGGLDATIIIDKQFESNDWIPGKYCGFQCKADNMYPKKCQSELMNKNGTKLKPLIKKLIEENGCYIIFCNQACNEDQINERIDALVEKLAENGFKKEELKNRIFFFDANLISAWTNKHLSTVLKVLSYCGQQIPFSCLNWEKWASYEKYSNEFVSDDILLRKIQAIRSSIIKKKTCYRVLGLSGTGKTRLVLESFKGDHEKDDLTDLCCYIDQSDRNEILSAVIRWRLMGLNGVLVVDNCPLDLHIKLVDEISNKDSNLSLITIDYEIDKTYNECPLIIIDYKKNDEIIKEMLKVSFPGLKRDDIERVAEFAQGFPAIAVLLAKSRLSDEQDIGMLRNDDLTQRLLWGREKENPDLKKEKILTACSLFENFGYKEEKEEELKFIAEKICEESLDFAYKTIIEFKDRGIVDTRGRYGQIVPIPLAVRLASKWWKECRPKKAYSLFTEQMPNNMKTALCDQLSKLHFVKEAQQIIAELCGEHGPFGSAEVLNTEEGSRLFRPLVEVNPQATTECLHRLYANESKDNLLKMKSTRRNIIWALEKLCFWEDTFEYASKTLFAFAWAENEDISNNATGQFIQLFHLYLSGTQKPAIDRLRVLRDILKEKDKDKTIICLWALGEALTTERFTIFDNAGKQGSRAILEYWRPKIMKDITEYFETVANLLVPYCQKKDRLGEIARKQFEGKIQGLLRAKYYNFVSEIIHQIMSKYDGFWMNALIEINSYFNLHKDIIKEEDEKAKINKMIHLLNPKSIPDKIELIISNPGFDTEKKSENEFIDNSEIKAINFTHELSKDIPSLLDNLRLFYNGHKRYGYIAGQTLADDIGYNSFFIDKSLESIVELINENQKPDLGFLCGYINKIQIENPEEIKKIIETFRNDDQLAPYYISIISVINNRRDYMFPLIDLLKENKINVESLESLSYGRFTEQLSIEEMDNFCSELSFFEPNGVNVAFHIAFMYCFGKKDNFHGLLPLFNHLFTEFNIFLSARRGVSDYHVVELLEFTLVNQDNIELAKKIASDIVICCQTESVVGFNSKYGKIIDILFKKYLEDVWDIFGNAFLSDDVSLRHHIRMLFNGNFGFDDYESGFLRLIPTEFLLKWLLEHPISASEVANSITVVKKGEGNKLELTELSQMLIDNFGDDEKVLAGLWRGIFSFGSAGPRAPYYYRRIKAIEPLIEHSNPNVKKWANETIKSLKDSVSREEQWHAEHYLRL